MELESQSQSNCILCLSKFSPKIDKAQSNNELINGTACTTTTTLTTTQISGAGEVTNFVDLCNFLRLFPVDEENQRIPCLPCNTILCLRCLEKVEFLKGLYAQLKEIGRNIKVTTRSLETVILENSGNCSKEDAEVEVICAKVFGENVKTVIGAQLTEGIIAENLEFKRKALELHEIFGGIDIEEKEDGNENGVLINQTTDVTSTHSTEDITETVLHIPKQFQCPVCAQCSSKVETFMEHIAKNHSGGVGESPGDPLIKLSLGAQNEVTINGKTSYKCPQCDELFERVKYLRYHVNSTHAPESRRAPPKIKCPFLCCFGVRGER